jgi:uncharacterized protein with ParB-like and HNH nuclease domain
MDALKIQEQIDSNRRTVAFDSYDITVKQLYDMIIGEMIDVSPEYQRHFKWDEVRQSQLIESLFLGIPIPSLFMATNKNSSWEVIDGLQRLTTIVNFVGVSEEIRKISNKAAKLTLKGLEKLETLNDLTFEQLPKSLQIMFLTRPIRVTVLNDRSDYSVRFDLFERLNTGGVLLHPQEIRNCIFAGDFNNFIKGCAASVNFRAIVKTTKNAERSGSFEELVLRFFAYYEYRDKFVHGVKEFLNDYMQIKSSSFKNKDGLQKLFDKTFDLLSGNLPDGVVRGGRVNVTPVVLFEAISVGTAIAIDSNRKMFPKRLVKLLDDTKLKEYTTGATNNKKLVELRVNYVKDELIR